MGAVRSRPAKWAALCALIVSGCASTNPPPSPGAVTTAKTQPVVASDSGADEASRAGNGSAGEAAGSGFDNIEVADAGLNGKVAVLRVGSEVAENNLLSVFAGLKNRTGQRLVLEVETIYKDKAGNVLNAGSWIAVTLKPHEEREYRSASISEEAVDFLIRVRRAQSSK